VSNIVVQSYESSYSTIPTYTMVGNENHSQFSPYSLLQGPPQPRRPHIPVEEQWRGWGGGSSGHEKTSACCERKELHRLDQFKIDLPNHKYEEQYWNYQEHDGDAAANSCYYC